MEKLTIFNGTLKPFKAIGKHQVRMLSFAFKYPTWHYHNSSRDEKNALNALVKKGALIVNEYDQFKINM